MSSFNFAWQRSLGSIDVVSHVVIGVNDGEGIAWEYVLPERIFRICSVIVQLRDNRDLCRVMCISDGAKLYLSVTS